MKENLQRTNGEPCSEDPHLKMLRLWLRITYMTKDSFRIFLRSSCPSQEDSCLCEPNRSLAETDCWPFNLVCFASCCFFQQSNCLIACSRKKFLMLEQRVTPREGSGKDQMLVLALCVIIASHLCLRDMADCL